jgi:YD repeat-containing protein
MVTGAGTTQYAYDAAHRLTSVTAPGAGAIRYGWNDNGNLTSRGRDGFE